MKIRTTKKLIKKYLTTNNINDIVVRFGEDFSFNEEDNYNVITIGTTKGNYQAFVNLCKELGYTGNANAKELCFFHELGHYYTHKEFNEEQEDYDNIVREHLYKAIANTNDTIANKALQCYYKLPQERRATEKGLELLSN